MGQCRASWTYAFGMNRTTDRWLIFRLPCEKPPPSRLTTVVVCLERWETGERGVTWVSVSRVGNTLYLLLLAFQSLWDTPKFILWLCYCCVTQSSTAFHHSGWRGGFSLHPWIFHRSEDGVAELNSTFGYRQLTEKHLTTISATERYRKLFPC